MTQNATPFVCPNARRWTLRRLFSVMPRRHIPQPETEHLRLVRWAESRRIEIPTRAARCRDCGAVILNAVGDTWGTHPADMMRAASS